MSVDLTERLKILRIYICNSMQVPLLQPECYHDATQVYQSKTPIWTTINIAEQQTTMPKKQHML